ncbi:6-carboxyhexanoate--CoA ligase [Acidovorax carolinensis]|uniref:6-carboxyhexanoate--CoA ligase n=1 Tax=Acidovorax carolinensis TaxID=553814 RepID=A0A240U7X8_9BURK|nr:acetate--CoA ligase family protein [Acidovorax carolinensis]ART56422.1 6-carboxyhexanoate--CoA ligase [Acidovorax carolinensis]ART57621.1 6-carboxyhexanoate--CoA ligase [Acidovorax carolinensis]
MKLHNNSIAQLAQALLHPASIALYGASDDVSKMGGRPVQFLKRSGFAGRIYPINPKRAEIQGLQSWPSLQSLPEVPDQVFVLTPTETVIPAVRECAALGVKVVTILASGFSESGTEGVQREEELRQIALETGIRILGPSSLGVVNPRTGLVLTANAAFAEPDIPPGKVFVASHSGSMIGALVSRGKARCVGFAGLVSVGSEVDLNIGEICAATLDDPAIEGYLLFLESMRHGPELRAFARAAHRAGKPVIAYKLGRSAAAAEMATTHTGAIAGEDDIADAFFKDLGIARVGVLDALLETFPLAKRIPLESAPKRVGVVTTTGGGAAMAVDELGIRGVVVEPPSAETLKRLEQAGLPCTPGRVLDMTLAGTKYETMKGTLDILLTAPEFDLVLAVVGSSARFQPQLAVKPIVECAGQPKPLAAMLVPDAPEALAALTAAGVPCFRSPEACGDAIAAVLARRQPGQEPMLPVPGPTLTLSEADAYGILDAVGVPHAPAVLRRFGSEAAPLPFAYPVVAKVCSADIPHKTEVGGVLLNIGSDEELAAAMATLRRNLDDKAPKAKCDEVLVQPMQKGLGEVLVGYRVDADAGPIIMLAAGGIWAEVAKDRSIRLAPVAVETAREMILEVNALKPLTGLRGKARGDLEALAHTVSAVSQLALRPELRVAEAEVNPLLILPEGQGVTAVDALVFQHV